MACLGRGRGTGGSSPRRGVFERRYTYDDHDRLRKVTELDAHETKLERERRVEHGRFGIDREACVETSGKLKRESPSSTRRESP